MSDPANGDDPASTAERRFVCDVMVGKLATILRMCGYDTVYALDRDSETDDAETDDAVLRIAREEGRTVVTRDRQLAEQADAAAGLEVIVLTEREWPDQAAELAAAGVELTLDEPTRCSACNGVLEQVPNCDPGDRPDYAPGPADVDRVWRCVECGQHFWRGSHWDDVAARLAGAIEGAEEGDNQGT